MISEEDYREVLDSEEFTNEEVRSANASKDRTPRLEAIHVLESTQALENRYSGRISK